MNKIDFKSIEEFSQKIWDNQKVFEQNNDKSQKSYYVLDMFPYPSGDGLHVGHIKGYTATDIISHYKRYSGFNVLHPMGWDAFGLPAENYAIKIKKNPKEVVAENVAKFKQQCKKIGFSYDWSKEINTTDPNYYKWTQWIFLKMFEKGLAYEAVTPINFCPSCKTGLANEEVVSGACERCGTKVEKKNLKQWILKITKYADRLLEDLDGLDWPDPIKQMQKNWIGKSHGTNVTFKLNTGDDVTVFTTRVDTLYGCTYMVLAPEHPLVEKYKDKIENFSKVAEYIDSVKNKSDLERTELVKEKTGVKLEGITATNPINNQEIPVFIADYVLANYGTGAVMAVPAHDERDYEFAKKYNIDIKWVIGPVSQNDKAFVEYGVLENSGEFNGLKSDEAKEKITAELEKQNCGEFAINYKLRDWIFSRQRYWGEPIPLIHCDKCGTIPVPESQLPVLLPDVDNYEPSGDGTSPLSKIDSWVVTECPKCSGPAKRETNTMPQWAGSCWYYLRFADPNNDQKLISDEIEKDVLPVDFYVGGAEHAVLHLLYARFWHKFLFDIGVVSSKEPFLKLKNVGLILAPDKQKMSKSRGNVINPTDIIETFGADALRLYEMFIGPFDQPAVWNKTGISGTYKFLEKVIGEFENRETSNGSGENKSALGGLISDIAAKIEKMFFNTAVSDFMKFSNEIKLRSLSDDEWIKFLIILSPFAPHTCEFLYQKLKPGKSIFSNKWPESSQIEVQNDKYVIQINGKKIEVQSIKSTFTEKQTVEAVRSSKKVSTALNDREILKIVYIKGRIVNFVVK